MREKKLTLGNKEYTFKPLTWERYPDLFTLFSKFEGVNEKDIAKSMDKDTIKTIMELELDMFKRSHPEIKEDDMKEIIQEHMFDLLPVLVEINFKKN